MFRNLRYTTLASGVFFPDSIDVQYDEARFSTSFGAAEQEAMRSVWVSAKEEAKKQSRSLFNAPLFRLHNVIQPEGIATELTLQVGNTDYKEYYSTRRIEGLSRQANPIGSNLIGVTVDGFVPFGKRSVEVDANPGRLFSFGGFFDREIDWNADNGKPDIFACVQREIAEEINVTLISDTVRLIAVVYDEVVPHPEFSFFAPLPVSSDELRAASATSEISEMMFVPENELRLFIEENEASICEGLLGGLNVYLDLRDSEELRL